MLMTIKVNLKLYTHESRMTSVAGFILGTIRFIQRDLVVSTSYLSNTPTNVCMALLNLSLFSFVLYCYAFVQYCNVNTIQYNTMHKFVGVLDNPPQHIHVTTVFLRSIFAVSLMLSSGSDQVKIRSKNRTRLKKLGQLCN